MVVAVNVRVDSRRVTQMMNVLPKNLETGVNNACYAYAVHVRRKLQDSLIQGDGKRPMTTARAGAYNRIVAKKVSKFRSQVTVPESLANLDSMRPHFVALKPGRNVTKWAKKHYGTARVSGRSRVFRTPMGGFSRSKGRMSNLFVTPMPFISRGLKRARSRLTPELRAGVRKAFRASKR